MTLPCSQRTSAKRRWHLSPFSMVNAFGSNRASACILPKLRGVTLSVHTLLIGRIISASMILQRMNDSARTRLLSPNRTFDFMPVCHCSQPKELFSAHYGLPTEFHASCRSNNEILYGL